MHRRKTLLSFLFLFFLSQRGFFAESKVPEAENAVERATLDFFQPERRALQNRLENLDNEFHFFKDPLNDKEKCYIASTVSNVATLFLFFPLAMYYAHGSYMTVVAAVGAFGETIWTVFSCANGWTLWRQRRSSHSYHESYYTRNIPRYLDFLAKEEAFLRDCMSFAKEGSLTEDFKKKFTFYHRRQESHDAHARLVDNKEFVEIVRKFMKAGAFLSRETYELEEGQAPWFVRFSYVIGRNRIFQNIFNEMIRLEAEGRSPTEADFETANQILAGDTVVVLQVAEAE